MASGGHGIDRDTPWIKKVLLVWTHSGGQYFADWLDSWAFDPNVVVPFFFLFLLGAVHETDPEAITAIVTLLIATSPITLPVGLFVMFWVTWIHYIRFAYWFESPSQPTVLLEVQLPPEVEKTPLAMETFLTALWNTGGETTFFHRIWRGSMRPVFALEIASNEGQVRFYLHTRTAWRAIVEARLYGQFPEAQVREVEDYAAAVPFNLEEYDIWGSEYKKGESPQALPIKTYVDFQLDKAPDKPENSVDPITNIIELLGSVGPGEHFWLQLVLRARNKDEWYGFWLVKDSYKDDAKAGVKKITEDAIKRAQDLTADEAEKKKVGTRGATLMTETEKRKVEAIERSLGKLTFEVGIRTVYMARKDRFNGINNASIVRFFDTFRSSGLTNALGVTRGLTYFDYPWQDIMDIRQTKEKRNLYFRYKYRAYFGVPYDQVPVLMSTEEVATLWHFPSSVVQSPSIDRVPAKVSQAPINLPVGPANLPR